MAYLNQTITHLLGTSEDFLRESYLESFIYTNPTILSPLNDAPEGLATVFILGRQEMINLLEEKRIADLICLIWDNDLGKYQIWVYELKIKSRHVEDVQQLLKYIDAFENPANVDHKKELIERAKRLVGEYLIDDPKIRGALCAQDFTDDVMGEIIKKNATRVGEKKILAVKINRFPGKIGQTFVLVEPLIGEDTGRDAVGMGGQIDLKIKQTHDIMKNEGLAFPEANAKIQAEFGHGLGKRAQEALKELIARETNPS